MMPTTLVEERGRAHFMTQRFDRQSGRRIHVHTYGGLDRAEFNVRQVRSYQDYLRAVRRLGMGQGAVNEDDGFTRADLLALGAQFDVPHDGAPILDAALESMRT